EVAVLVELADVAGGQPAVLQRLPGGLLVLVVALADVGAADQDLAVVGDLDVAAVEGLAHLAELAGVGPRDSPGGGGLGHAPPLEDEDAGRVEEAQDLGVDRGGARDAVLDVAAEEPPDLGEDLLVGDLVLLPQQEPDPLAGALAVAHLAADADRPVE